MLKAAADQTDQHSFPIRWNQVRTEKAFNRRERQEKPRSSPRKPRRLPRNPRSSPRKPWTTQIHYRNPKPN